MNTDEHGCRLDTCYGFAFFYFLFKDWFHQSIRGFYAFQLSTLPSPLVREIL